MLTLFRANVKDEAENNWLQKECYKALHGTQYCTCRITVDLYREGDDICSPNGNQRVFSV